MAEDSIDNTILKTEPFIVDEHNYQELGRQDGGGNNGFYQANDGSHILKRLKGQISPSEDDVTERILLAQNSGLSFTLDKSGDRVYSEISDKVKKGISHILAPDSISLRLQRDLHSDDYLKMPIVKSFAKDYMSGFAGLKNEIVPLTEQRRFLYEFTSQLSEAVEAIYELKISHTDLAFENIGYSLHNGKPHFYIIDLGLARYNGVVESRFYTKYRDHSNLLGLVKTLVDSTAAISNEEKEKVDNLYDLYNLNPELEDIRSAILEILEMLSQ